MTAPIVHVRVIAPAAVDAAERTRYHAVLDAGERRQQARFMRESDRDLYLIAHGQLRLSLSELTAVLPANWRFGAGPHGRPFISSPSARALHFSLSHTDGLVAIAIARTVDVGVDVERTTRRVEFDLVARRVFTTREIAWMDGRRDRFFVLWTLKEAYAKARGQGFAIDFRRIEFAQHDEKYAIDVDASLGHQGEWQFEVTRPTPEHVCAVAIRPRAQITYETRLA
jgi:4'-phosphopantetheinyl transferase